MIKYILSYLGKKLLMSRKMTWNYIAIAIIALLAALFLQYYFDQIDISSKNLKVEDINGNEKDYTVLLYSYKYVFTKILADFLITLSIAVIIFFLIENKLKGLERRLEEKDKEETKKKLDELHTQINRDVFEGVLKKVIPAELFDILASDVLNPNIVRQNTKWEYEITETDKGWRLEQFISYEMYNITNIVNNISLHLNLRHSDNNDGKFSNYKFEKNDGTEIKIAPVSETAEKRVFNLAIAPKQIIRVKHNIANDYNSKYVTDCHFTNYSIIGLDIRVRKPQNCKFTAIPTFTQKLEISENRDVSIQYEHIKGLLIGQCLVFIIEPIKDQAA